MCAKKQKLPKTVLVVDNNEIYVEAVSGVLTNAGYEVKTAPDGVIAIQTIVEQPPDFILLDIVMPKIGGERVCRYLKSHPKFRDIPLIIVSGAIAEQDSRLLEVGADAYIVKSRLDVMGRNILDTLSRLSDPEAHLNAQIIGLENIDSRAMVSELIKMRRHNENILQNLAEGVIETDDKSHVVFLNEAVLGLVGKKEWQSIGTTLDDLFSSANSEDIGMAVNNLLENTGQSHYLLDLRIEDRALSVSLSRIIEEDRVTGLLVIIIDVTEREQMQEGLLRYSDELERKMELIEQTQKDLIKSEKLAAVTKLVAGVAHEIKNPLNSMTFTTLNLESLINRADSVEKIKEDTAEHLSILKSDIERVGKLVNDFMRFAKPRESEPERIKINDLCSSVISYLKPELEGRNITVVEKYDDCAGDILGEEDELGRAFSNLVRNSIEAIDNGGKIFVETENVEDKIKLTISDSGVGIPTGVGDKIFDLFFTTKEGGHGMGLAQVLRTITSLGGSVNYTDRSKESSGERGTKFSIIIPVIGGC